MNVSHIDSILVVPFDDLGSNDEKCKKRGLLFVPVPTDASWNASIASWNALIASWNASIASWNASIASRNASIALWNASIASWNASIVSRNASIASWNASIALWNASSASRNASIASFMRWLRHDLHTLHRGMRCEMRRLRLNLITYPAWPLTSHTDPILGHWPYYIFMIMQIRPHPSLIFSATLH